MFKKKTAVGYLFTAGLMAVLGLAVCIAMVSPAAAGDKTEILIGANVPLSGGLSGVGQEQKWAYQTAVDDINAKGGVFVKSLNKKLPVRLIVADDESDPGKASAAVERLIKVKKVDFLLGGFGAALGVIPGCIAAEKHRRLYVTSMCVFPPWHEQKFKYSTLMFWELPQACSTPYVIWNSLPEAQRPKKPALIMEDTFDGRAIGGAFKDQAAKHGYKFALDVSAPVGSKDYSSQIIKAKTLGVDAVIIFGSDADCGTFLRQMKENNFSVPYLHGLRGFLSGEFYQVMGKDSDYILSDGHWSMDYPFAGAKELGERFHKKFDKYSVTVGPLYALGQVLFASIEKAGVLDSLKVREAMLAGEFDTVMGKIKYNQHGFASYPCPVFQWWQGRQHTVYPFELTKYKLKLAPPWDKR